MSLAYLPSIYYLQDYMSTRNAIKLNKLLFLWNLIASLLSGYGAYYILPLIINNVISNGIDHQICDITQYDGFPGLIMFIFNITKMLEWVDTIFLVLRKKKIIFLHWFHHLVTMLYCWYSSIYSCSVDATGTWFAGINLFVHFIMYGYYGLTSIGIKLANSFLITLLQFVQMIVGIFIIFKGYLVCNWQNNIVGYVFAFFMYSTYLYLFFKILIEKINLQFFKKND